MEPNWYTSIVGISAASIAVGAAVRQWLADVAPINKMPLVIFVGIASLLFTSFAYYGLGALEGNILRLLTDALTAAVGAVGTVGFISNIAKPLSQTSGSSVNVRKFSIVLAIGLVGSMSTACAFRAGEPVSIEANLAVRGSQLVAALDSLTVPPGSSPIERLVESKVISRDDALKVAGVIRTAMGAAKDLGHALQIVDEAKSESERLVGVQRASTLIRQIARGLASAPISVGTESGRQAVVDLLTFAANLLLTIGSIFPAPEAVTPPPGADSAAVAVFGPEFVEIYIDAPAFAY